VNPMKRMTPQLMWLRAGKSTRSPSAMWRVDVVWVEPCDSAMLRRYPDRMLPQNYGTRMQRTTRKPAKIPSDLGLINSCCRL